MTIRGMRFQSFTCGSALECLKTCLAFECLSGGVLVRRGNVLVLMDTGSGVARWTRCSRYDMIDRMIGWDSKLETRRLENDRQCQ